MTEPGFGPEISNVTSGLADRWKSGDQQAAEALYKRLAPALAAWGWSHLQPNLRRWFDTDEFVQEVWLALCSHHQEFDANQARFRAWVFGGFAPRVLLGYCRRARKLGREAASMPSDPAIPATETTPARRAAKWDIKSRVLQAVIDPTPEEDLPLLGLVIEGASPTEIARALAIEPNAASVRKHRLIKAIRGRVEADLGPDVLKDLEVLFES